MWVVGWVDGWVGGYGCICIYVYTYICMYIYGIGKKHALIESNVHGQVIYIRGTKGLVHQL
jgi:hypothetical protein